MGAALFTGAALDGVPQDVSEEEVAARPDPQSCKILPWDREVAWFASDLWCRGKPFEAGARNILKRQLARLDAMGLRMNLGMEAEFFVLRDTEDGGFEPLSSRPHLEKPAYDAVRLLDNKPWIGELVDAMNELGYFYLDEGSEYYDPTRGLRYLTESADRGDIYGYNNLGLVYMNGLGGQKKDAKLALDWAEDAGGTYEEWGVAKRGQQVKNYLGFTKRRASK